MVKSDLCNSSEDCKFYEMCFSAIPYNSKFPDYIRRIKEIDIELLEFFLFKARKIVKKEMLKKQELENIIKFCENNGIDYFVISSVFDISQKAFDEHRYNIVLYKDRDVLRSYIDVDLTVDDRNRFMMGNMLGYPECCVNSYKHTDFENSDFQEIRIENDFTHDESMECPLINPYSKFIYRVPFEDNSQESFKRTQEIFDYIRGRTVYDIRFEDARLEHDFKIDSQEKKLLAMSYFGKDSLHIHIPCSPSCTKTIQRVKHILEYIEKKFGKEYVLSYLYYMKKKYMFDS